MMEEQALIGCIVTFKLLTLICVHTWLWYRRQYKRQNYMNRSSLRNSWFHTRKEDFNKTIAVGGQPKFLLEAKTLRLTEDRIVNTSKSSELNGIIGVSNFSESTAPQLVAFAFDPILAQCKLPYEEISFLGRLSSGTYGEVWHGLYNEIRVAIKQIREDYKDDPREIESFVDEIKLTLPLHHPNILKCLGCSWHPVTRRLCFLTPYMAHGDIFVFLRTHIAKELTWRNEKIHIAMGIALGLLHLHHRNIVHRDLKSKNVLLDTDWTSKITDFGISRVHEDSMTMTSGVGTPLWTAPEVFHSTKYTESVDIYSFGVILSELDTLQIPYSDQFIDKHGKVDAMRVIRAVVRNEAKPSFLPSTPPSIYALAMSCMSQDPKKRPTADCVVRILQTKILPQLV